MSAIAGICFWDGRPDVASLLAPMAPILQPGGPDHEGTFSPAPGVVLRTHLLHFDRLSRQERQPHTFANGCVLSFDGRLDNRDDLLLTLHRDLDEDVTDVALAAAAYRRWGLDAPHHLIGDWSFALYDGAQRRLLLARDYMGNRPLYYHEVDGGIAWATSIDALVDAFGLQPREEYIASLLTYGVPVGMTPYAGAEILPASHTLVSAPNAPVRLKRYWTLDPTTIRYKNLATYADHARSLLTDAVRQRLRADGRVWSHLSGGWDSSSIVCIANGLVRRRQVEASSLQPISMVIPDSPESDESKYIDAVERWCGLSVLRRTFPFRHPTFQELLQRRNPRYYQRPPFEGPMQEAGEHIVLSGEAGDLAMLRGAGPSAVSMLEPLYEGHPARFAKLLFVRARHRRLPMSRLMLSILRRAYRHDGLYRWWHERQSSRKRASAANIPRSDLAGGFGVTPELFVRARKPTVPVPPLRDMRFVKRLYVGGVYQWAASGAASCINAPLDVWRTYPYTHRPLIEYMAGIPQLAFWDPCFDRAGMGRALQDVLPPELLSRNSKGEMAAMTARSHVEAAEHVMNGGLPEEPPTKWEVVTRGYVLASALDRAIAAVTESHKPPSDFLANSLALEAWLRGSRRGHRRPVAAPSSSIRALAPLATAPGPSEEFV